MTLTDSLFAYFFIIYPFIEGTAFMACMNYLWHMCYNPDNPECEYTNRQGIQTMKSKPKLTILN